LVSRRKINYINYLQRKKYSSYRSLRHLFLLVAEKS
jgi:hypothetical protein